jgi:hypothetical protein
MKPAAPFPRLTFTGPGAAARAVLASERHAVAGKPEIGHALATGANRASRI